MKMQLRTVPMIVLVLVLSGCSRLAASPTQTQPGGIPPTLLPTPRATATPLPALAFTPVPPTATHTPQPTATPLPTLSGRGGGVLAFAREDSQQRDIYLANADGSQLTALTDDLFWDNWPSWSPDGSQLVFTCRQRVAGLGGGICAINADGSNRRQLSNSNDWEPSWSPDGRYIVFASQRDGNPGDLPDERRWQP